MAPESWWPCEATGLTGKPEPVWVQHPGGAHPPWDLALRSAVRTLPRSTRARPRVFPRRESALREAA